MKLQQDVRTALLKLLFPLALLIFPLAAQQVGQEDLATGQQSELGDAPAHKLVDFGEIFKDEPDKFQRLSDRFQAIEDNYGFSVFFVAYSGIIGSGVSEKAELFRDHWLGREREGLVLVCDTDLKTMAFALTKVDGLPREPRAKDWKLPDYEAIETMQEFIQLESKSSSESEYLYELGEKLAENLETRLASPEEQRPSLPKTLLAIFALVAAFVSWLIWWIQRKSSRGDDTAAVTFPMIPIESRLGARYGGGLVGEISYRNESSTQDRADGRPEM
ncbi:hypothetical protein [Roseibacillus persicicus]|uniref:TPM domain-containing protein n=1 Tax=Roseibacillus persicicus TaxID=454148 RepID=A0A918TM52_9BACT|nr:hypothetical protein [Roseibacillus persicicus]GHC54115.1 hypothetical protein GCM10007100_20550 [Roseibacillus persicicus]